MKIEITSDMSNEDIKDKMAKLKPKKVFDADKYLGKVKWDQDPLAYQKNVRNEWN